MSSIATDDPVQTGNLIKYKHDAHQAVSVVRSSDPNNPAEYIVAPPLPPPSSAPASHVDQRPYIHKSVAPPAGMQIVYRDPHVERAATMPASAPAAPPPSLPLHQSAGVPVRNGANGDANAYEMKRNGTDPYRKTIQLENNENENGNGVAVDNNSIPTINPAELSAKEDSLRAQIRDGMPYGQLQCGNQEMNITESKVFVGRNSKAARVNFHVGENTYVSRKHIQVIYDRNNEEFFMMCLSKNGIFMDDEFQSKRTVATRLPQRCTFRFPSTNILVKFQSFIDKREPPANGHGAAATAAPVVTPQPSTLPPPNKPTATAAVAVTAQLPYHPHADHLQSNQTTANQTHTFIDNNTNKPATNAQAPLKINIPQHETGTKRKKSHFWSSSHFDLVEFRCNLLICDFLRFNRCSSSSRIRPTEPAKFPTQTAQHTVADHNNICCKQLPNISPTRYILHPLGEFHFKC